MLTKTDLLLGMARNAGEKAKRAHTDDEGALQRTRQIALNQLATNEDWLNGVSSATAQCKLER